MSDTVPSQNQVQVKLVPPSGDSKKAEKYISKLIELINKDRLSVAHTDLKKFDPTSLQDHYQLELADHQVEISHGKQPTTGKDYYTILFNNLQQVRDGCSEKIILAYMHLTQNQFDRFAAAAGDHHARRIKEVEEKRFADAVKPIDEALDNLLQEQKNAEIQEKEEIKETFQEALDNIDSPVLDNSLTEQSPEENTTPTPLPPVTNPFLESFPPFSEKNIAYTPPTINTTQPIEDASSKKDSSLLDNLLKPAQGPYTAD